MSEMIDGPVWVPAGDGYELALVGTALTCRNAKGRTLKSVPKKVRDGPVAEELTALRDWLVRHEEQCRAAVESWMLGSFPVPGRLVVEVWPDPAWRGRLENLVVDAGAGLGFLRGVDDSGRVGIVDLDGETRWSDPDSLVIPHPVLLKELDDLREFAVELELVQAVPQLGREVFRAPERRETDRTSVGDYSDGVFKELRQATGRANRFGYKVRGGYAVCTAYDDGVPVQARFWVGSDDPQYETWTGELAWVDREERPVRLADVGPVAWSEGVRMAELIYAGRHVEEEKSA